MSKAGADCNTSQESLICANQIVIRVPYGYEDRSLNARRIGSDRIDVFPLQLSRLRLQASFGVQL